MNRNRNAFESFVLEFMGKITPGKGNVKIYKNIFAALNDNQFETFVQRLEQGQSLPIWLSNYDKQEMINFDNVVKLAKEYGVQIEQQLIMTDEDTGIEHITPETFFVGTAEVRKQRQMLVKKFSAAKDDSSIDDLTGQVIGVSKGGGLSYPEAQVLIELGLPTMTQELYDVKGGDLAALDHYRNELTTTGKTNTKSCLRKGSGVKALQTAHFLLRGRGLENNLDER